MRNTETFNPTPDTVALFVKQMKNGKLSLRFIGFFESREEAHDMVINQDELGREWIVKSI